MLRSKKPVKHLGGDCQLADRDAQSELVEEPRGENLHMSWYACTYTRGDKRK